SSGENAGHAKEDPSHSQQQNEGAPENDWLTSPETVRNKTLQRTAKHPTKRNSRSERHRLLIFAATGFLQETNAPRHPENRRRNEQQPRDQPAEDRLPIKKHCLQRTQHASHPTGMASGRGTVFLW